MGSSWALALGSSWALVGLYWALEGPQTGWRDHCGQFRAPSSEPRAQPPPPSPRSPLLPAPLPPTEPPHPFASMKSSGTINVCQATRRKAPTPIATPPTGDQCGSKTFESRNHQKMITRHFPRSEFRFRCLRKKTPIEKIRKTAVWPRSSMLCHRAWGDLQLRKKRPRCARR